MSKVDLIPDLFDASLIHVINDSEEAGTVRQKPEGFEAIQANGKKHICMDQKKAIQFLLTGKMTALPKNQQASNQYSLF